MEKTIKYLENGEYHYATVRDVGDLAKLKTDSKDDLVTAINELFITGGEAPKNPDGYDELVDNVADAIQKQQQMTDTITNMQQSAQLSDAEMEHMKQVQEELHQEYLKAIKELNEAVDKAKADAADLDKKTSDLQDKLDETFASVDKEVSDVHKQLDSESAGLRKDLDDTKTSLESTRKDLLNNTQEFGVVNSEVKELKDKMDRRIWSTDLDPVREQVNKNTTEVSQTKDELKNKADQSSLDLVTNSVENLSTQVKENADGLKVSVKKDELGGDVARLLNDKTNLLLGTRSFSGEDNWKNRDTVTIEPGYYKGLKSAAVQVLDASIYQPYRVKANTAYTFSFFGKEDRDNPKATLVIKPIDAQNVNVDGGEQQVHITTEWQRFAVTFSLDQECEISIQIIQGPEATNNILHLAGLKLQYGQNDTPWEPNEADVAENIEHTESQFNVYSDQIAGIVKKQEKMGDTERQLDTRITETAEGLKQTSKDLQDANGKITEFKGQLESTARGLKTEYEKYTNDAIGQISDSSLNLIHNSSFSNGEDELASWQNVSAKVTVKEDNNGLHWIELTQTGQSTDNPIGITSNYFIVKQGKVTVAVDIKLGDKANIDNQNILLLELYNDAKQRVDFTDVSLEQLGLSMDIVGDHNVHRGLYRLGIDRKDVKYMTVKAILHRNGDLWLTNFSARLSSIDDGGYTPNPDDVNQQILKQNTKIEQNAKEVALKANSVDVTRDIKSAVQNSNGGGVNLLPNSKDLHTGWTADGTSIYPVDDYLGVRATGGNQRIFINPTEDTKGKLLSVSFDACVANDSKDQNVQVLVGPFGSAMNVVVSGNDFKHYKAENWKWNSDYSALSIQLKNVNDKINVKNIKLEYGPVATPWTPNSQDTSEEIKSAKDAAIKVASDQINIHVNELSTSFDDKLDKRVNEVKTASEKFTSDGIEQTVKKITDVKSDVDGVKSKVDNLKVGGRNLQTGTGDCSLDLGTNGNPLTLEDYDDHTKMIHTTNGGFYTSYSDKSFVPIAGKTYTISADVKGNGTLSGGVFKYEGGDNGNLGTLQVTDSWQRVSNTVHINEIRGQWIFYPDNSTDFYLKHLKIEEGNMATDWTPAPEDVDSKFQYKEVTGVIDFNDLKTQQKIFYKDTQAKNSPAGGTYWYFVDVDVEPGSARIIQTATSDRNNITWKRTFADTWTAWQKQASQGDIDTASDGLRQEIKSAKEAAIKVSSDQINLHVNEITSSFDDKLNKRVNEVKTASEKFTSDGIEQTVRKIIDVKNQVDDIQIGGRNLLHGTSDQYRTLIGDGYLCKTTASDMYTSVANYHAGDWFTYAATITNNSTKNVTLETWLFDGNKAGLTNDSASPYPLATYSEIVQPGQGSKRVSTSFRISGNTWYVRTYVIFDGGGAPANSKVQVKDERLVEGNMAGTWSPNPDDVDKKIDTQTLDSANIDQMKTQGHYFVHNLTGNPIGGWVYVDVMGVDGRIRQDVYQDNGTKHMYRRLFGDSWSGWEQGAYLSDVSSAKTEVTASVKNLGDRVTTEVNSITTRQNNLENESRSQHSNDIELVRKSDFEDGEKGTWSTQSVVAASSPAPPAELGQSGMKVLQTNTRDAYEEGIWYSVKPGEKFNIDFWCAPSSAFPSQFGLAFVDKDKRNYNWQGVPTKQSGPWEHCTGIIEAPANAAFAKPWFQMDKPGDNTGNTAWLAKPHIRRQDPRVADTIKEINTQLDVANGQIQGKVTATDVNNILNGKGYATQSWAQSQFRMKSDSIDLEVQKITNPIQNKLASVSDEFNKRIKDNLLYGTASFIGNWRNWSNDKSWIQSKDKVDPYGNTVMMRKGSWEGYYQPLWLEKGVYTFTCWYWLGDDTPDNTNLYFYARPNGGSYPVEINVTRGASLNTTKNSWQKAIATFNVTKAGNSAVRIECDRDITLCIGSYKLEKGPNESMWCEQPQESSATDIISKINITPDNIKLASNKIVLDGDTQITGKAFIPSAAIQNINAEKITTGTLDVGKLNIKNLKADDITTGILSGVTIKAGDKDDFFQTSEDNIYWITNSGGSAVIGKGKYVQYPGLNVFDNSAVYLGSWAGAELNKDGTINDYGGAIGNPKLAIETGGMRRRFNVDSWGGEFEDKPLDNNRIISWVGNKEFLSVERENGTHIELNPDINGSQFTVQKDDKFGAYFGQGRDGNEINFTPIGGMTINGNFRVTGAKNAIVKTSQGTVAINAYETAGYFFGDIGSAKTSDNKVAMIDIESLFKETVNTDVEYQVFLTSYGPGDIWVSERQRDYFVVESELPNMEFGWEIKAKRKGYENTRLAKVDVSNVPTV